MAAILKIDISPYLSEKSSNFYEILYTAADFELDERHVIKNEKKLHWTDSEFDRMYFLLEMAPFESLGMVFSSRLCSNYGGMFSYVQRRIMTCH